MKEKKCKDKAEEKAEINRLLLDMMEDYNDSVIPPLSQVSTFLHENQTGNVSNKCMHENVQTECERRCKMVQNFNVLNNMIPDSFPKVTRERIVVGTIQYIKFLNEEIIRLVELKKNKDVMLAQSSPTTKCLLNPAACISVSGNTALFGIELKAERSLVTKIFMVFDKHKADVLAANVSMINGYLTVIVIARVIGNVDGEDTIEKIKISLHDII